MTEREQLIKLLSYYQEELEKAEETANDGCVEVSYIVNNIKHHLLEDLKEMVEGQNNENN